MRMCEAVHPKPSGKLTDHITKWRSVFLDVHRKFTEMGLVAPYGAGRVVGFVKKVIYMELVMEEKKGTLKLDMDPTADHTKASRVAFFGIKAVKVPKANIADFDALAVPSYISVKNEHKKLVKSKASKEDVAKANTRKKTVLNIWHGIGFRAMVTSAGDLVLEMRRK